jgi:DHA1 family bicyclomycin/chloramphenicol resistance-like MFS transporter
VAGTLSLPESLPPEKRIRKGLGGTFRQYAEILKDKTFQFSVLQQAFNSAILMSYVACSPSVFMGEFGLSEQTFGAIFGMNALSMLTATQIHRRLLKTRKIPYLLSRLLVFQFVAGMALLAVGLAIHVWWVVIVLTMLSVCVLPSITAGSTTLAMTNFSHAAAQASSVIGLVQSIAAASISAGLVLLPIEPLPRMLAGMSGAAVLALVTLWLRSRQLHRQA